jgi:starvation-inducible outer membrane lipoprotein
MKNLVTCILITLFLSSCSYAFKESLRKSSEEDIPFSSAQSNIERDTGAVFIWGGVIVNSVISESGNYLEVVQTPLNKYGKVVDPGVSEGRFIVYSPSGIDPDEYVNGRLISVIGFLIKGVDSHVDGAAYTYPVVEAIEIRPWDMMEGETPRAFFPAEMSRTFQWNMPSHK